MSSSDCAHADFVSPSHLRYWMSHGQSSVSGVPLLHQAGKPEAPYLGAEMSRLMKWPPAQAFRPQGGWGVIS